jgi:hypothetical protein
MGDRANIVIVQNRGDGTKPGLIFLYSHWGGSDLPRVLRSALVLGKSRWDDEPYLTRIIFCQMIRGCVSELTGHGISDRLCDNDSYPLLVVDTKTKTVSLAHKSSPLESTKSVSFEAFATMTDKEATEFRDGPDEDEEAASER